MEKLLVQLVARKIIKKSQHRSSKLEKRECCIELFMGIIAWRAEMNLHWCANLVLKVLFIWISNVSVILVNILLNLKTHHTNKVIGHIHIL